MTFAIKDYIPSDVFKEIKEYLRVRGNSAHEDYEDAGADEDSVTGALGAHLRHPWKESGKGVQGWQWSVRSKKFVGKGPYAQEPIIGADAIVEFVLQDNTGEAITKGLLFQAKKEGSQQSLKEQVGAMEGLAKKSSAVIDYSNQAYRAIDGADFLAGTIGGNRRTAHRDGKRLGDYLADEFIECNVGIPGMSYDAVGRELRVPSDFFGLLSIPAELHERIRIVAVGPLNAR